MAEGTYVPATAGAANAIRNFSDAGIEASMRKQLANLEAGKRGAVVMYADADGVKGAIYGRKPGKLWFLPAGEWSYVGTIGSTFKGELSGGAAVAYSW
jgi:hypothetical protein